MNKVERAAYCASLLAIIQSQESAGSNLRSAILSAEYDKNYKLLKQEIENEARTSINK